MKARLAAAALTLSLAGAAALVHHEGTRNRAYLDSGKVWTICTGHTRTAKPGMVVTDAECARLLQEDLAWTHAVIRKYVLVPITQEQFDALASFVFNFGETKFRNSTLLRRINAGQCMAAGAEFSRWNKDNGVVLNGLVKRRAWERKLWESGC
jgi:lysozyme